LSKFIERITKENKTLTTKNRELIDENEKLRLKLSEVEIELRSVKNDITRLKRQTNDCLIARSPSDLILGLVTESVKRYSNTLEVRDENSK